MRFTHRLAIALAVVWLPRGASAQDVEMLGRHYGTRPPAGYYRELAQNPDAFRFTRGRAARMRESAALRSAGVGAAGPGGLRTPLGPPSAPVIGNFHIPVLLGRYSDSGTAPYDSAEVNAGFFTSNPNGTVTDYYDEVSGGRAHLTGDVFDWVQSTYTRADVVGTDSGLSCCGVGDFIKDLLARQPATDWGRYDNDGPDGVPNSGDDDGFVDVLAVFQPQSGAECDGTTSRVWSHKWALSQASGTHSPYSTTSPAANGGTIQIDDYFIQGVLACSTGTLSPIGVFTHEAGHSFGLPDLYDTRPQGVAHAGDGSWDLMASGNFGCDNQSAELPCHMGAWTKSVLGWVDVTTVPPDTDLGTVTLPPVETSGQVYRVDAEDGSGEYFLIENRQKLAGTFDRRLYGEGVLVWQIDADAVTARWPANTVNSSDRMGVWIRQADGLDQLGTPGQGRGDGGDPFPGQSANFVFHAGSNPASRSFAGTATGLTMLAIQPASGDDMRFDLLTRLSDLTVSSTGTASTGGILTVDGAAADPPDNTFTSAPFDTHVLEAAAGDPTAQPGERVPFQQWQDGPTSRTRTVIVPVVDTAFVAEYGGLQYELHVDLTGGVNGVVPGTISATPPSPDLWFAPDQLVQVEAVPQTGFTFQGWTGALAGRSNPDTITMDAPVQAGADFSVVYAVANADLAFDAAVEQSVQLSVINGTGPVAWALVGGSLPDGIALSSTGLITGAALEVGAFPLTVQATDALGLTGTGSVTLDVRAPDIPIGQLASPFVLGGPALSVAQKSFLDRAGNQNGSYDLGDLRAWVLAHPSLPLSASLAAAAPARTLSLPVKLGPKEGSQ